MNAARPHPWRTLAGLVLLATALRVIGLDSGLWIDEIYSLLNSFRPPVRTVLTVFPGDNQHPLYSLLAHGSLVLFGESAWVIRLPAVVFGVASVPMLYLLGTRVTSRREALLAAALLAVSYHHVWFSQNARGYSALAFFALLATYLLLRAMDEGRVVYHVGYALAAAFGIYTHLTMAFIVAAHALVYVTTAVRTPLAPGRSRWRGPLIAFGLAGALTLLLYAPILGQVGNFFVNRPSRLRGISTPSWAFFEALRVLRLGVSGGVAVVGGIVLAAGGVLVAAGVWSFLRERPRVALLFLLPGLITLFGALAARGTMYPRFFFSQLGFGILIVVRGATVCADFAAARLRLRRVSGAALGTAAVTLLIVASAASLGRNYRYPKQDFEGAMRYVLTQQGADDVVVTAGVVPDPYTTLYHLPWHAVSSVPQLRELARGRSRVWVLYTFPRYLERGAPDLAALIQERCASPRVFRGTVGGGDVLVCALERV